MELLLNVVLEYKTMKTQQHVDWESCQSKYVDIYSLFLEQYPAEPCEEFPHRKAGITLTALTTQLKDAREKYRNAKDDGPTSGHDRLLLLYFELCEQLWGDPPAACALSGDSADPDDSPPPSVSSASSTLHVAEPGAGSEAEIEVCLDGSVPAPAPERREPLHDGVKRCRSDRLKRKVPADVQWQNAFEEDQSIKKKLVQILETAEEQASADFKSITDTLDRLTASIHAGFALLRQVVNMPQHGTSDGTGPPAHTAATHFHHPNSAFHSGPHTSAATSRMQSNDLSHT